MTQIRRVCAVLAATIVLTLTPAFAKTIDFDSATIAEIKPAEVWVTHGREEALVRWCELAGIPAKPLHLVGYEDEEE